MKTYESVVSNDMKKCINESADFQDQLVSQSGKHCYDLYVKNISGSGEEKEMVHTIVNKIGNDDEFIDFVAKEFADEIVRSSTNPETVVSDLINGNIVTLLGDGYEVKLSAEESENCPISEGATDGKNDFYDGKVTITINTENDAFADGNAYNEIAKIISEISEKINNGYGFDFVLKDTNGNECGKIEFKKN